MRLRHSDVAQILRRMIRRSLLAAVLVVLAAASPAASQDVGVCAERFPEVEWVRLDAGIPVYATGVPEGHAARYAGEVGESVGRIGAHYDPFDAIVCLFGPDSGFDTTRCVSGSE